MRVVEEVGKIKKLQQLPPLDSKRWEQVIASRVAQGKTVGLSEEFIKKIYEAIHECALELERKDQ